MRCWKIAREFGIEPGASVWSGVTAEGALGSGGE
jgi:hypothetical protein